MMNLQLGMVAALVLVLILVPVFEEIKKPLSDMYDEMQTLVRANAYKYATLTGVFACIAASFLLDLDVLPVDGSFAMMTVCFLMITVYVMYMIMKGVYFGISGRRKKWTAVILVVGLCNIVVGVFRICEDGFTGRKLIIVNTPVVMGAMFMIIAATVLIQKAREKEDAD